MLRMSMPPVQYLELEAGVGGADPPHGVEGVGEAGGGFGAVFFVEGAKAFDGSLEGLGLGGVFAGEGLRGNQDGAATKTTNDGRQSVGGEEFLDGF